MTSERRDPATTAGTDRPADAPTGAEAAGSTEREDDARDVVDETLPADRAGWDEADLSGGAKDRR